MKNLTINFKQIFKLLKNGLISFMFYAVLVCLIVFTVDAYNAYPVIIYCWILLILLVFIVNRLSSILKSISKILKTVFLKKDYVVFEFNSWSCKDENQVIEEFFKNLSEHIGTVSTSNNIQKYVKTFLKCNKIDLDILGLRPTLKELYGNIEKVLDESNKKIIVFIDDMDRMTGQEIFNILKLVKVVANFPNIIYVLAYNKDYVASELSSIVKYKPEEYLEKIITNEFRLPNIKSETLEQYLFQNIDKYVGMQSDNYDREGIINSFATTLQPYICNLRKVYRVLNSFAFQYTKYKAAGILINVADLFYLTVIKVFNLNLYDRIWNSKKDIYGYKYQFMFDEEEKKKHEEKCIIGNIERASISNIDQKLIEKIFEAPNTKYDIKRLKDENHFDLYFSFEFEPSVILQTKIWLDNYPSNINIPLDYRYNPTFISDMQDLMYSTLYYEYRNLNFVFGLFELMIRNPNLAEHLYVENNDSYLNERLKYLNEYDKKRIADFINKNKDRCEINLLEKLLFDGLFSDRTSELAQERALTEDIEIIKQSTLNTLINKLKESNLMRIYSLITLRKFIVTYQLSDIVKIKFLEYLNENDENIVAMIQHFTTRGVSSSIGNFYNLYIIEQIIELGLGKEYKERLTEIRNNKNIMENTRFVNYYVGNKEHSNNQKIHIVDKSILLIEKYCTISK